MATPLHRYLMSHPFPESHSHYYFSAEGYGTHVKVIYVNETSREDFNEIIDDPSIEIHFKTEADDGIYFCCKSTAISKAVYTMIKNFPHSFIYYSKDLSEVDKVQWIDMIRQVGTNF